MLSPEREGRLTASLHPTALGWGYQSPQAGWRRWHGIEVPDEMAKVRMAWGSENESSGISEYEILTGDVVKFCLDRQLFVPYESWSGCTPDGFSSIGLVEVKAPRRQYDEPPTMYWIQCQSQMFITGTDCADLIAWTPDESRIWRTLKDISYWAKAEPQLKRYWKCLTSGLEPKRGEFKKMEVNPRWNRIA